MRFVGRLPIFKIIGVSLIEWFNFPDDQRKELYEHFLMFDKLAMKGKNTINEFFELSLEQRQELYNLNYYKIGMIFVKARIGFKELFGLNELQRKKLYDNPYNIPNLVEKNEASSSYERMTQLCFHVQQNIPVTPAPEVRKKESPSVESNYNSETIPRLMMYRL